MVYEYRSWHTDLLVCFPRDYVPYFERFPRDRFEEIFRGQIVSLSIQMYRNTFQHWNDVYP